MMLLNHLSSQEMIQLLEEKGKRGKRKKAMLSRERAEEKNKKKQKKEYDKQNAVTTSIRIGKKDDKPDEIWIECMECMRLSHIIFPELDCDKRDQEYKYL